MNDAPAWAEVCKQNSEQMLEDRVLKFEVPFWRAFSELQTHPKFAEPTRENLTRCQVFSRTVLPDNFCARAFEARPFQGKW